MHWEILFIEVFIFSLKWIYANLHFHSTPWWVWWSIEFGDCYFKLSTSKINKHSREPSGLFRWLLMAFQLQPFWLFKFSEDKFTKLHKCTPRYTVAFIFSSLLWLLCHPRDTVLQVLAGQAVFTLSMFFIALKRSACRTVIILIWSHTAPFLSLGSFYLSFFRPFQLHFLSFKVHQQKPHRVQRN